MAQKQENVTEIALNVARTRVTVLVFNLTIISLMLSILVGRGPVAGSAEATRLTITIPLFVGFCLTVVGLFWILRSQNWDREGLSRPVPFTLGAITTHFALSQTITAFMQLYLVGVRSAVTTMQQAVPEGSQHVMQSESYGRSAFLILFVLGSIIWVLTTYVEPLWCSLEAPVSGRWKGLFVGYCCVVILCIHWGNTEVWCLVNPSANTLRSFALQFVQPVLWLR